MKRAALIISVAALLFIAAPVRAFAYEESAQVNEEELMGDFYAIIPEGVSISRENIADAVGFESFFEGILLALEGNGGDVTSFFLLLLGFAVLCTVAGTTNLFGGACGCEATVAAICSAVIFKRLYSLCLTARESLITVIDFCTALLPIMTAVSSSSGAVATASVQAVNMNMLLGLIGKIVSSALMPLAVTLFVLSAVASVDDGGAGSVAKGIKGVFMWIMGITSAVASGAVALQSLVASASDTAALRAARYAASGLIPIVGSTVSGALSTLAGGLAVVKGNVGALSVAVIVTVVLVPLVSLLLYRLAFSLCIIFLDFAGSAGGVRCFLAFRSALDGLTAVYTMSTLVCIVQVVIFMKSGVSLS